MDNAEFPSLFSLLFKHIWVLFIGVTVVNAFSVKFRSKKYIEQNPDLQEGYEKFFRSYMFYMNLPWAVLGVGMMLGGFNSIFDVMFGFRNINFFTVLFFGTIIFLWVLGAVWIYFHKGAEFLVEHPGALNSNVKSPLMIKIWFALSLAGGIFGLIFIKYRME